MARGDLLLATNAGFHVGFCTSNFSDPVGGTLLKKSLQSRYVAAYVATRQGNQIAYSTDADCLMGVTFVKADIPRQQG